MTGKISIVGIGTGNLSEITPKARLMLDLADVIVGYKTYIELIGDITADKKVIASGMRQEVQRAKIALDIAQKNLNVAVISSGDAGIYGMAGLVIEMILTLPENLQPQFEIAAGVSSLNAAAAILGAPLMHDFAVISLSDWLTPYDLIKKRVALAAEGDFVIALFNPKSKSRPNHIYDVQQILLNYRAE